MRRMSAGALRREKAIEDWRDLPFRITSAVDRTMVAGFDETAKNLVLFMKALEPDPRAPHLTHEVRRRDAERVYDSLMELRERVERLAEQVLHQVPPVGLSEASPATTKRTRGRPTRASA